MALVCHLEFFISILFFQNPKGTIQRHFFWRISHKICPFHFTYMPGKFHLTNSFFLGGGNCHLERDMSHVAAIIAHGKFNQSMLNGFGFGSNISPLPSTPCIGLNVLIQAPIFMVPVQPVILYFGASHLEIMIYDHPPNLLEPIVM